jgi:hypothetical protein
MRAGRFHHRLSRLTLALSVLSLLSASAVGAAAATAAAPAPADEAWHLYTTVRGDTVIGISRRLLTEPRRWPELARLNRLANANRIATGAALRIPLAWMRVDAAPALVQHVSGSVTVAGGAASVGQALPEGSQLSTGADGHLTVRLVDGTVLRLRPGSQLQLRESHRVRNADVLRSGARLNQGRVEVEAAPAPAGRPGFNIDTPQGVLGVRGTEFRVAADTAAGVSRGEVLGGVVAVQGRAGTPGANAAGERLAAGFGTVVDAAGQVAAPVPLLPRADLTSLPMLQERILMRFVLPTMTGAAAYRAQLATDSAFNRVLAELTSASPELRFAELPDGDYLLRVRGIDARGLEGQDSDHRFRLKARPEAPLPTAPAPRAVITSSSVELSWAGNPEAQSYRWRLVAMPNVATPSAAPDFKTPLREQSGVRERRAELSGLAPGVYHWQLGSVRADGDAGPWGDARSFELRALPPVLPPPRISDGGVSFAWEALPGQSFDIQVARDAGFTSLVFEQRLAAPNVQIKLTESGRFYVRLRARDADGYVGPYNTPQFFELMNCVRDGVGGCVRAGEQTLNLVP